MIRLITLNLQGYEPKHGEWHERKGRILELLKEVQPDICAFQAVRRTDPSGDQTAELASELDPSMYRWFCPATDIPHGQEGLVILSRLEMLETQEILLPPAPGCKDQSVRCVARAKFLYNGTSLTIFNSHFSWVDEQRDVHTPQALRFIGNPEGYAVVVGDFNAQPETETLRAFKKEGWIDSWTIRGDGAPGFTFESNEPSIRIDYMLVNQLLADKVAEVTVRNGVGGGRREFFSDHAALVATLSI